MTTKLSYARSPGEILPAGWAWSTLDEVADVIAGNPAPQGDEFFAGGKYQFVRVQDMGRLGGATKIHKTNDCVNDKATRKLRLFPKGSVLFTKSGASTLLNQRAILARDMYVVSHIAAAIPKSGVLSEWLYYWMRTVDFAYLAHATTLPSLPLSKAKAIPIPLAPLDQQQRIVAEIEKQFSRLDEAVANLKRVKANLKRYKAAVLKAAVEGKLTEEWRKQHADIESASELLKRILDERRARWSGRGKYKEPASPDIDNLPLLPEGWTWASSDQLCSQITDGEHIQPRYQSTGRPMLSAKNVRDGYVDFGSIDFISESDFQNCLKRCAPREDDVLIVSVGATTGRTAIVGRCQPFAVVRSVLLLRPVSNPRGLLRWLQSPWCQAFIRRASGSTAQAHLYIKDTRTIPVPLPPLLEQKHILAEVESRLSVIAELDAAADVNLNRSNRFRQAILGHAFAGRLVPKNIYYVKYDVGPDLPIAAEKDGIYRRNP